MNGLCGGRRRRKRSGEGGRGGVNVLREKVKVSIHHHCGLHMFCKPQLQPHTHSTFLHPAQPHTLCTVHILAIHQWLTLKINSIMHHTSPLLRTTRLTYSTAHISGLTDTLYIYTAAHMHDRKHVNVCLGVLPEHTIL